MCTGSITRVTAGLLQKLASKFQIQSRTPPVDMQWSGSDAVVLLWPSTVVVAAQSEFVSYPYPDDVRLVLTPEVDSLRILTSEGVEMVQIVPLPTQDIFAFGSTEPASLLFDSFEDFAHAEARADQNRRQIQEDDMSGF